MPRGCCRQIFSTLDVSSNFWSSCCPDIFYLILMLIQCNGLSFVKIFWTQNPNSIVSTWWGDLLAVSWNTIVSKWPVISTIFWTLNCEIHLSVTLTCHRELRILNLFSPLVKKLFIVKVFISFFVTFSVLAIIFNGTYTFVIKNRLGYFKP